MGGKIAVGILAVVLGGFGLATYVLAGRGTPAIPQAIPKGTAQDEGGGQVSSTDYNRLIECGLAMPVPGVNPKSILDTFNEMRGTGRHEATDIPAPYGSPVVAVNDGVVRKLFFSVRGGNTIYEFDPTETYCYYYAHLDRYAEGLKEGQLLKRGAVIGYVGASGDASISAPHLHFAIFKLGPDKRWWQGTPIDPYPILMAVWSKKSFAE
jgi:peptidoglycan LD-endopeptidase LytH